MHLDSYTVAHIPLRHLISLFLSSSNAFKAMQTSPFLFYIYSVCHIYAFVTSPETVSSICLSDRPSRDCDFSVPKSRVTSIVSKRPKYRLSFFFSFLFVSKSKRSFWRWRGEGIRSERTESGVDFGEGAGGFAEEDRGVWVGLLDGGVLFCEERSRRESFLSVFICSV